MPLTIPTVAEIRDQIISDVEGSIGQSVPLLPRAFVRVLAAALAGVQALCYRYGRWAVRQIFAATADEEALVARGAQYGLTPSPAVAAVLTAQATGTDGTTIPAGTLWIGDENSLVYSQNEAVEIAGGTAAITVRCLTAGDEGNLAAGQTLTISTPIAGVDSAASVTGTTTTGEDAESVESFRAEVQERERHKPQGGAPADYVQWALEVPGIVKAFAHRITAGYATVYPMIALSGDRIPDEAKREEVRQYLADLSRKPLQSTPVVEAMTEVVFDVTITDLVPNTADVKARIESQLEAYLLARFPRQYPDEVAPTDTVSTAALSGAAVDVGMFSGVLTMTADSTPATTYTLGAGELARLGTVTWA